MQTKNIGLSYGAIYGGVSILFTLVLYILGASTFVSPVAYLGFVFPFVFAVLGGLQQKKSQGGYLEFSAALKVTFLILVIGSLLQTLFMSLLLNYIDVPFREALNQEAAEMTEKMMRKFGAMESQIEEAKDKMMSQNNYSFGKQSVSFAFGCIFWFLMALIISAIIKKKKPEFEGFPTQSQE